MITVVEENVAALLVVEGVTAAYVGVGLEYAKAETIDVVLVVDSAVAA